jgi:hypothetical protein
VSIAVAVGAGACGSDPSGVGTADSDPAGAGDETMLSSTTATTSTGPHRTQPTTDPGLDELPIDEVSGPNDVALAFVAPGAARAGKVTVVELRNDHVDDDEVRVEFFEGSGTFLAPQSLAESGAVAVPGGTIVRIELVVEEAGYVELLGTSIRNPSYQFSVAFDVSG